MTMKPTFAEALRLADEMGLPDYRGWYISPDWLEEPEAHPDRDHPPVCAVGGAAWVTGVRPHDNTDVGQWPNMKFASECMDRPQVSDLAWVKVTTAPCPVADCRRQELITELRDGGEDYADETIFEMIVHLYDDHTWTRGEIADWLDALKIEEEAAREELEHLAVRA